MDLNILLYYSYQILKAVLFVHLQKQTPFHQFFWNLGIYSRHLKYIHRLITLDFILFFHNAFDINMAFWRWWILHSPVLSLLLWNFKNMSKTWPWYQTWLAMLSCWKSTWERYTWELYTLFECKYKPIKLLAEKMLCGTCQMAIYLAEKQHLLFTIKACWLLVRL